MKRTAGKKLRKRTKIVVLTHGIYHGKLRTVVNRENKIVTIISEYLSFETQIISSSNHVKGISLLIFPDRLEIENLEGRMAYQKKTEEETPKKEKQQNDRC